MPEVMRRERCAAAHSVSPKHFMKARLFHQRGHLMNESEWVCLQSRFSTVTWMECVDHSFRSASDSLTSRTAEAALCRYFAVGEYVRKELSHWSLYQRLLLVYALVHTGVVVPQCGWWQGLGIAFSRRA